MKLITRNTDYAMRALCHIAQQKKEAVTVTEMVAALGIPRPFLRKIVQTLSGEGILASCKGQGGGFSLRKRPGDVRLTDLIRVFQGTIQLNECIFKKKICPMRRSCALKREIDGIERDALTRLHKVSIASLIRKGGRHDAD